MQAQSATANRCVLDLKLENKKHTIMGKRQTWASKPFKGYIPFTSDFGFKATFGNERNTGFLSRALQALIRSPVPITGIEFIKTTLDGDTPDSRAGIFDIACTDAHGDIFIVEMQVGANTDFMQRMKFYSSQRTSPFIKKGKDFNFAGLPKIYTIAFLDFQLYGDGDFFRSGKIRDEKGRIMDDRADFIVVELGKFTKTAENCITDFDKLVFSMKTIDKIDPTDTFPEFMKEDWLQSAIDELDFRNKTPHEYAEIQIALARESARRNALEDSIRFGTKQGLKQGLEQGLELGIEQGLEQGLEQGMSKAIRKIMRTTTWTDAEVAEHLDAPMELVIKLRAELQNDQN